jgi:hypothetical protein
VTLIFRWPSQAATSVIGTPRGWLARPVPHPRHTAGGHQILSSGSSVSFIVVPGTPGCLPGRRLPRSRSDRSRLFNLYGLSDDGGRDDTDESRRTRRSRSSTRAASRSFRAVSSPISRYASASRAASSAAGQHRKLLRGESTGRIGHTRQ